MRFVDPPGYISSVLSLLTENGYAAFLVGGCVRDAVLGRNVSDWDIATSATPAEVAGIFPKTFLTGEKYGTVTVLYDESAVEVTTFRTEGTYSDGRRPERVEFISSLEEDLSRRDFTVNAMAVSPAGELIDPFGGIMDIEARVIRCVGDPNLRFGEDALRMLRAFRLSAQLGFTVEPETLSAVYANAGKAGALSAERIRVETEKTLMSKTPETIGQMMEAGLLDRYLTAQGRKPDGLDKIAGLPEEPVFRWCALCAALLASRSITSASEFLREMRMDARTVKTCARALSIPAILESRTEIKGLLAEYGEDAVRCAAAIAPTPSLASVEEVIASGECYSLDKLAVTGNDLIEKGRPPGQGLGETLSKLLGHVVEHPEDNTREILLIMAEEEFNG